MNIVIIPQFNAAVNIPNMSSNETDGQAGINVSVSELKNAFFLALESVETKKKYGYTPWSLEAQMQKS